MKHLVIRLTMSIVLTICLLTFVFAQGTTITLLHVNDTHSHLDAFGPKDASLKGTLGGIAKAATAIGRVRATEDNVLLVHSGDFMVGDFFFNQYFGVPELQIMRQLGFDAMAVGNHEFDGGAQTLYSVLTTAFSGSGFPLLSANLDLSGFPALKNYVFPSIIKECGGVKVGIFGMTVPGNPTSNPEPVIIRDNIFEIAQQTALDLRSSGANVVICLSHLGFYFDKLIAKNIVGIDFIVGGHDHYLFTQPISITNPEGKQTLIMQAEAFYKYLGKLKFTVNNGDVTVNDYQIIPLDASIPAYPDVQNIDDELKGGIVQRYGDVYNTVVGTAVHDLEEVSDQNNPSKDTPLGNLVTDAFRKKTRTKIAITANGLIAEKIYAGPIVGADVFRALSYGYDEETGLGFRMATFDIRGLELIKGLEIGLSNLEYGNDFFLQVSGMTFKYNPKKPVGNRVIQGSVQIDGRPFIPHAKYSATVNTGILYLLGIMGIQVENVQLLSDLEYNVVKDYIARLRRVKYNVEGRIKDNSIVPRCKKDLAASSYEAEIAGSVTLFDNYPNPFNPTTTISYEIPDAGFVSLKIYNTLGQEVATLANENIRAGHYDVVWNAANLPSGVYFYKLQAGNFVKTKKMLLAK